MRFLKCQAGQEKGVAEGWEENGRSKTRSNSRSPPAARKVTTGQTEVEDGATVLSVSSRGRARSAAVAVEGRRLLRRRRPALTTGICSAEMAADVVKVGGGRSVDADAVVVEEARARLAVREEEGTRAAGAGRSGEDDELLDEAEEEEEEEDGDGGAGALRLPAAFVEAVIVVLSWPAEEENEGRGREAKRGSAGRGRRASPAVEIWPAARARVTAAPRLSS